MNALKTNKFRVGEEVTFIEYEGSGCWEKGFGLSVGDVVQIESIDEYSQTAVVISKTGEHVWCNTNLLSSDIAESFKESKTYNPLIAQEGGGHYKNRGIQPIEYSEANNLGACQHSVVKYITRHQDKNGIEDLSKIIHFTFLEAYFKYGEQGSTELKEKVLKLLGEHG